MKKTIFIVIMLSFISSASAALFVSGRTYDGSEAIDAWWINSKMVIPEKPDGCYAAGMAPEKDKVYVMWTNDRTSTSYIYSYWLDGTCPTKLYEGFEVYKAYDMCVLNGKVYWIESSDSYNPDRLYKNFEKVSSNCAHVIVDNGYLYSFFKESGGYNGYSVAGQFYKFPNILSVSGFRVIYGDVYTLTGNSSERFFYKNTDTTTKYGRITESGSYHQRDLALHTVNNKTYAYQIIDGVLYLDDYKVKDEREYIRVMKDGEDLIFLLSQKEGARTIYYFQVYGDAAGDDGYYIISLDGCSKVLNSSVFNPTRPYGTYSNLQ